MPPSNRLERAVTAATIMGFIAQIFGLGIRGTALSFVGIVVAYFIIDRIFGWSNLGQRLRNLKITPLMLVAAVLLAILVGAVLRQHYIDSKIVDLGEVTDNFHWRLRLCFGRERCIANTLADLSDMVPSRSNSAAEELFSDQALGEVVRTSSHSVELLRKVYGINDRFVGAGQALPSRRAFISQRTPEFLVFNYNDDHVGVLAWRLTVDSPLLKKPLRDLINSTPFNRQTSVDDTRNRILQNLANSDRPSLIRFAMVPDVEEGKQQLYSGCFALPVRHRAFFSSLDHMMHNTATVEEAADLSGYEFNQQESNQHMYIFVFAPAHVTEVIVPTWRNLLTGVTQDVQIPPACRTLRGN